MFSFVRAFGIVALACAVAACNGSSGATPNAGSNASSTVITVTTLKGAPISQIIVVVSTGITNGQPTGIITSDPTNAGGQVTFFNLPSAGQLCVSASTSGGGAIYRTNHCAHPFPARYTLKFNSNIP